ncbi:MAG TPA: histidine triad nucleotide-binding protein [bacterium]|jgi:histidine triad (HIT) family protein
MFKKEEYHGTPQTGDAAVTSSQDEETQSSGGSEADTTSKDMNDCIFCKIISGQIPSNKILETEDVFAFRDIAPQAPQHVLILPKKHVGRLADLRESDGELAGKLLLSAAKLAHDLGMEQDGFRVVINNGEKAGQSVFHLHVHLLSGREFGWPPG